jgi:DNA excision repair protein ERCC-3
MASPNAPLIVQADLTVLLELAAPDSADARGSLTAFAELVKSPEHIHTFRITPLSIWNACSTGFAAESIIDCLERYSRYAVPKNLISEVRELASRFGKLVLTRADEDMELRAEDPDVMVQLAENPRFEKLLWRLGPQVFGVKLSDRGRLKIELIKLGLPVRDLAGFTKGEALEVQLAKEMRDGTTLALRPYQVDAARAFYAGGAVDAGSGVVVLPCGAGKTIVGMAAIAEVSASTLVLTTNTTAVRQWMDELLDKTTLTEDQVGEYTGAAKNIRPVTIATYQVLTHRQTKQDEFTHLGLFDAREWGLIIYDEVHLLPAPVFQATASLQARRRLGLTATLVREDGLERDVFALIGPKCWDMPWKELEQQGWIAKATCTEIRVELPRYLLGEYAVAAERKKLRIAAENPEKIKLVRHLIEQHPDEPTLVIGTFVDQLKTIAKVLDLPLITGTTPQKKRDELFEDYRQGKHKALVVSKVANFAVDLPDASVAIQVSGTFGSRQEEAQRLGRLLRPKKGLNQASFYSLVTSETKEEDFAIKRQLFLCEQGYEYTIIQDGEELLK